MLLTAPSLFLLACTGEAPHPADDTAPVVSDDTADTDTDDTVTEREVPLDGACNAADRVGGFALTVTESTATFSGVVRDGPDPALAERQLLRSNECVVFEVPPTCDPACGDGMACWNGECGEASAILPVGAVTLTGLGELPAVSPDSGGAYALELAYPTMVGGEILTLDLPETAAGPVRLWGVGAEPFAVGGPALTVADGQPIEVEWPAGSRPVVRTSMVVTLRLGGTAPRVLRCTFADDTTGTIPADAVSALYAGGGVGTPTLEFSRQDADRDTTGACLDFVVSRRQPVGVVPGG